MSSRLKPGVRYFLVVLFAVGFGALMYVLNQNGVDKQMMSLSEIYDAIKSMIGK
ncbi:MAG: hypothetical protein UH071_00235 [Paludibacteraceae bacterium]|nr:hypothetical protein [Paludibacteraceae bacterium]